MRGNDGVVRSRHDRNLIIWLQDVIPADELDSGGDENALVPISQRRGARIENVEQVGNAGDLRNFQFYF